MARVHPWIVAALLGLTAIGGVLVSPESKTWAASGDVMFYLGSAESVARGGGLRAPLGPWHGAAADSTIVTSHYPPGFTLALAVPIVLGAEPELAARLVRAFSLGASVVLTVLLVSAVAGVASGTLAGVLVLISPFVVFTHTILFSEPFFMPFVVATVALMTLAPERPLTYGATAALALGVRLIGVALTGAVVLWALAQPGQRIRRAFLAFLPSVVVEGLWQVWVHANRAGDDRHFGYYGPLWPLIRKLVGVNLWWFWPVDTSSAVNAVAKLIVLVVFIAVCVSAWRQPKTKQTKNLLAAVALVLVAYDGVYLVARLVLDWANEFEIRNFATVDILFAIALAASLRRSMRVSVGVVAVWMVAATYGSWQFLRDAGQESREWAQMTSTSPLLTWIRQDNGAHEIYTNFNALVWRATNRRTRDLPLLDEPDSLVALAVQLERTQGVLVGWSHRPPIYSLRPEQMVHYASPERIATVLGLRVLVRSDEGAVWGPPSR